MPNRIIKESICTSDSIDKLTIEAERLFYRLIVNCDDFGTLDARLPIIKSKCFPLKSSDITDNQLQSWLTELETQKMIFFYENLEHPYLKMSSWERQQQIRAKRPKYPLPGDEKSKRITFDIICNQEISNVTVIQSNPIRNPIQSESNTESIIGGKPPTKKFITPSVEEIKAYCAERKNSVDAEYFHDFYESKGWLVGKAKMKDWKSAIRNAEKWEKFNGKKQEAKPTTYDIAEYENSDAFGFGGKE